MPVAELLARTSSAELTEWMAYERITGPLGTERADVQAALIASTIANALAGRKGRRARVTDFLPKWDRSRKPAMDWREMLAEVKRINRQLGGIDLTEGGTRGDPGQPAGQARHRRRGSDRRC